MKKIWVLILCGALIFCLGFSPFEIEDPQGSQGNNYFKQGDYQKAEESYIKALQGNSPKAAIYYNLGNTYFRLDPMEKALEQYHKALGETGDTESGLMREIKIDSRFNLGNTYMQGKKLSDAINAFRKVLKIVPGHQGALNNLKIALYQLQQQQKKEQQKGNRNQDKKKGEKKAQQQQSPKPEKKTPQKKGEKKQPPKDKQKKKQQAGTPQKGKEEQKKEKKDLTKQDGKNILDALRQREKNLQMQHFMIKEQRSDKADKDW